jgi:hypothetical protein
VLLRCLMLSPIILSMSYLGVDKCFCEVRMNFTACFNSCLPVSNRPRSNLVNSNCIKVADLKFFIASFDNILNFRFLPFIDIFFVLNRIRNHFSIEFTAHSDTIFNLSHIGNIVAQVVLFR